MMLLRCSGRRGVVFRGVAGGRSRRWCQITANVESAKKGGNTSAPDACERVTKVGAVANVALCGLKGVAGVMGNSSAMVADAVHSLGDLVSDAVTLGALRYARVPPNETFPFGRGKVESLGALAVSGLLIGTSMSIAQFSYTTFLASQAQVVGSVALVCAGISVVTKEVLYRITVKAGKEANSSVTVANAHHHRSDAYSSVVAIVGIAGNMAGYTFLDPLAGGIVALMILKTGIEIGMTSLKDLVDVGTPLEDLEEEVVKIVEIGKKYGVKIPRDQMMVRAMGPFYSMHLVMHVKSVTTVSVASQMAATISKEILDSCEPIQHVFISSVPVEDSTLTKARNMPLPYVLRQEVQEVMKEIPEITSVTHFTPHYLSGKVTVNMEVIMDPAIKLTEEAAAVARRAEALVLKRVPSVNHVDVHLELRNFKQVCHTDF
eukprot:TRINITY_DN2844_c0_g1_i2.p1 TRINITY_DN2844_c0_g1~~TRINITY_DN2844_c0_g1_i2.p1  ORF type:complete len:433 (+),score=102.13 TRINITY_DN2844_c0_g1_i2:40-1338(+)